MKLRWLAFLLIAGPAHALQLTLPVDCKIGQDCFIQNYPDHDTSAVWSDYSCGALSYDGHKGTDFRIKNDAAMRKGVAVLAVAPGRVRAVRDGEEDTGVSGKDDVSVTGKECGNGVVIKIDDEYETQYCHLRKNSVRVKAGDRVESGTLLGMIGKSGAAQFPHVHFELRKKGVPIDPFTGTALDANCGKTSLGLWKNRLPYSLLPQQLSRGFTVQPPTSDSVQKGLENTTPIPANAAALILWVDLMGVRKGDEVRLTILSPHGQTIAQRSIVYDRNKATAMAFIGKKNLKKSLEPGEYRGEYRIMRTSQGEKNIAVEGAFLTIVK